MKPDDSLRVHMDIPRSAFITAASVPEFVSQHTCLSEFGVPPRGFLEDIGSPAYEGEVIRRGKLRIVKRADYIAFLRRQSEAKEQAQQHGDGADALLAEMGLRVERKR